MPTEVPHTPTKLFYKQELFLSTVDGTHPIVAIVGKCAVLDYGEYICSEYPLSRHLIIKIIIVNTFKFNEKKWNKLILF